MFNEDTNRDYKMKTNSSAEERIQRAVDLAIRFGGTDEMHHMRWVVDQMVRALTGDRYDEIVVLACDGEDGPNTYEWDCGIAP